MAESRADELRRRLERDPGSRLFAQLAEELRKAGEVEEAIGIARTGLERHPTYPSARLTLGRALLDSGDPAAARVELETAVRDAPDNILASRLLGEALETLGDLGSALLQYRTTLEMAPGDKHIESRVRAIQERLGGPEVPAEEEQGPPPEITKPMPAVATGEGAAPVGWDADDPDLPPTIRIRMPGDAARLPRAPLPPTAAPEGAPPGPGGASEGSGGEAAAAPPTEAQVTASELPATLPMPGQEAGEPRLEEVEERGEEAGPGEDEPLENGDMAPTLPKSRAPEFAALDEALPRTLPPGVITSVEAMEAPAGAGVESGPGLPEAPLAAEATEAREEEPEAPEAPEAPLAPEVVETPEAEEPADSGADVATEAEPGSDDEAVDTEVAPTPDAGAVAGPEPAPLSSATLAELYFQQGLLERAVEVYRQVLEEEPGNDLARTRLEEIEKLVTEAAAELPVPASEGGDERAVRRRALERAIERLEALLVVVRRR